MPGGRRRSPRELSRRNAERQSIERRVVARGPRRGSRGRAARETRSSSRRIPAGTAACSGSRPRVSRGNITGPVLLFGFDGDRAVGSGRSIPGRSVARHAPGARAVLRRVRRTRSGRRAAPCRPIASRSSAKRRARTSPRGVRRRDISSAVEEAELDLPLEEVTEELLAEMLGARAARNGKPAAGLPLRGDGVRGRAVAARRARFRGDVSGGGAPRSRASRWSPDVGRPARPARPAARDSLSGAAAPRGRRRSRDRRGGAARRATPRSRDGLRLSPGSTRA